MAETDAGVMEEAERVEAGVAAEVKVKWATAKVATAEEVAMATARQAAAGMVEGG